MGKIVPTPADLAALSPLHIRSERCPVWWVLGSRYTLLLTAEDSGGAFSLLKVVVPAGRGSPLHTHAHEDETFHVIEGEVEFSTGGQAIHARLGSVVFGPRGVSHSFCNVGTENACLLCIITPGGLERFFMDGGVPAWDRASPPPAPTPEDIERVRWAALKYGLELHDPDEHEELASPLSSSGIPSQRRRIDDARHLA
ncbi:MAG: cupin domain-containing protein [Acetobacteraceae bacterium]|nr:cupin domain-containing protein [Acetobacteraceae bacterium]